MPAPTVPTQSPITLRAICSESGSTYRPGDLIHAYAEIRKNRPVEVLSLHGSLVGQTRVWKRPADRIDLFETMIHTHLDQTSGFPYTLPATNNTAVGKTISVPITFVLPELVKSSKFPAGRMPPSCEAGTAYVDPMGRRYMQPLIEYYVQITLGYRLPGEENVRNMIARQKIKVTTSPHDEPPAYSQTFSDLRPVTASAEVAKSRFSKPFARLELSMAEPGPVVGRADGGVSHTTADLRMTWDTCSEAYDEFELGRWPVKVECKVQSRTRYDTTPFRSEARPSKQVGAEVSTPQTRIETMSLGTFEVRPSDRRNIQLAPKGSKGRSHTGTISLPIRVGGGATPTFSHLLASRDYTVVVKAMIQGLHHEPLYLETPLQVCQCFAKLGDISRPGKTTESNDTMTAEVLPRYEDHRYSLVP